MGRNRTQKQRINLLESLMQSMQATSKHDLLYKLDEMIDMLTHHPEKYKEAAQKASGKTHGDYMDWLRDVRKEVARA
jgi:hypothetical protein